MNDELPATTEQRCPRCGTESVAWVTRNPPRPAVPPASGTRKSDQFECRKCNLLFDCYEETPAR